jgi:hypothetical protein
MKHAVLSDLLLLVIKCSVENCFQIEIIELRLIYQDIRTISKESRSRIKFRGVLITLYFLFDIFRQCLFMP